MPTPSISSPEREKTLRVAIKALRRNPAYLALFCLGILGGGVVGGAYITSADPKLQLWATVLWFVFLLACILIIAFVETRSSGGTSAFGIADDAARSTFENGASAELLAGHWQVHWYQGHGDSREPYDPDPQERAVITTAGTALSIHSYDPSTKSEYWLLGRLSDRGDVASFYWSKPEAGMLTGVVFLTVDKTFEYKNNRMSGFWSGRTRDEQVTSGDVEMIRLGHEGDDG